MSPVRSAVSTVAARARDALWLETAMHRVEGYAAGQQAALRRYHDAALRRTTVAEQLTDEPSAVAALVLYRDAIPFLVAAIAVSRDVSFDPRAVFARSPWAALSELARSGGIPPLPAFVDAAQAILSAPDTTAFDELTGDALAAGRAAIDATVRFLASQVDTRTPREIKVSRFARVGAVVVLVASALVWWGMSMALPPDVALHAQVTTSGHHPNSTAPFDNSGAVNGEIEPSYGVHTNIGSAWVLVDLGKVYKVSTVKIYNRGDGYFDDGLPFTLELSQNGTSFTTVDRRTTGFTQANPWTFSPSGARARYVRISSTSYVALAEIEVYGRPP